MGLTTEELAAAGMGPRTVDQVLAQYQPMLTGLAPEFLVRPRVLPVRAIELSGDMFNTLNPNRHLFSFLSPAESTKRQGDLDKLKEYALLFTCATIVAGRPVTTADDKEETDRIERIGDYDERLTRWIKGTMLHIPEVAKEFPKITPGTGVADDAMDTINMTHLVSTHWDAMDGVPKFTKDDLKLWSAEALVQYQKEAEPSTPAGKAIHQQRIRAYSLWARAYNELHALGQWFAFKAPEAGLKLAGIHPPFGTKTKNDDEGAQS